MSTDDDTVTGTLTVSGTNYQVDSLEIANDGNSTTVVEDETFDVSAVVENIGNLDGSVAGNEQDIVLNVTDANGNDVFNATNADVGLTVDGTSTETFSTIDATTDIGGPGEYTVTVSSDDDSVSGDLTVRALGFEMQSTTVSPTSIDRNGGPVDVDFTVNNEGDSEDTQDIVLEIRDDSGSTVVGPITDTRTLAPGDTVGSSFDSVDVSGLATGTYTVVVSSDDSQVTDTLTVEALGGTDELTVTADPGLAGQENDYTFEFNASEIDDSTDVVNLSVDFGSASGVDASSIVEDNVSIVGDNVGGPQTPTEVSGSGTVLDATVSNNFVLGNEDGNITVTVQNVSVPNSGTPNGGLDFLDDADTVIAGDDADYTVAPEPASVSGAVTDSNGDNVTEGQIDIYEGSDATGTSQGNVTFDTDSNTYDFSDLTPGEYTLEVTGVSNQQDTTVTVNLNAGEDATEDIQLTAEPGSISGAVELQGDNIPNGEELNVTVTDDSGSEFSQIVTLDDTTTTGDTVAFSISGVTDGEYTVSASVTGGASSGSYQVTSGTETVTVNPGQDTSLNNNIVVDNAP